MKTRCLRMLVGTGLLATTAVAQSQRGATAQPAGAYGYFARAGVALGAGSSGYLSTRGPTVQAGGVLSVPFFDLELGVLGPQAGHSKAGYLTTTVWVPLRSGRDVRNLPLAVGGYTREFDAGNALHYGLSLAHTVREGRSIQLEARDYWMPSNSSHTVMFRVVMLVGVAD
ncbi:MAG: hypothetical protein M3O02_07835 [Acidobacteriota bacterium]|nr:hypothetical protein [Acidobacteriota bacterium]